jgi:hypothetical protein
MATPSPVTIVADRLYSLTYRPQELALYGENVRFHLRCAPIFEDPAEVTDTHYRSCVLEISADLPADPDLGRAAGPILLLKIGWEIVVTTAAVVQVGTVPEAPGEAERMLNAIAETVNDLSRRAGLDAPLGPEVVTQLLTSYRLEGIGD